jgi:hypothetical protein
VIPVARRIRHPWFTSGRPAPAKYDVSDMAVEGVSLREHRENGEMRKRGNNLDLVRFKGLPALQEALCT